MQKILKTIIAILLAVFVLLAAGLHLLLNREGGRLVREKLEKAFHRPVKIGAVRVTPLFALVIDNLQVEGVCSIRRAVVRGGMFDLTRGNFILSELRLNHAEINLSKAPAKTGSFDDPETPAASAALPGEGAVMEAAAVADDPAVTPVLGHYFFIKKLIIENSVVNLIDPGKGENGVKVTVRSINGLVRNLQFPAVSPVITSFSVTGSIPWETMQETGKVELSGWINLVAKDMRADLKVSNIDGLKFYPYCREWLDMEKANIGKAMINFRSQISGLNNDVTMDCHLEVAELQFKGNKEGGSREEKLASAIVNILQATNHGKIVLDFKMHTAMDSPEFGFGVIRSAFETKVSEAIRQEANQRGLVKTPLRIVGSTFKAAGELTRSVINGTMELGSAVAGSFRQAFTRGKTAQPTAAGK